MGVVRDAEAMTRGPEVTENPTGDELLTAGAASPLIGVRWTLHHWDHVGLVVSPSGRTSTGYRLYSADDVVRIHRVLVYRELGFSLAEVGEILDDPSVNGSAHLEAASCWPNASITCSRWSAQWIYMMEAQATEQETHSTGTKARSSARTGTPSTSARPRNAGATPTSGNSRNGEPPRCPRRTGGGSRRTVTGSTRSWLRPRGTVWNRGRIRPISWPNGTVNYCPVLRLHPLDACVSGRYVHPGSAVHGVLRDARTGLADWLYRAAAENARVHGVNPDTATWE